MTEADEMFEGLEQDVKDLLKHYESLETYTDCEEYRKQGAISPWKNFWQCGMNKRVIIN